MKSFIYDVYGYLLENDEEEFNYEGFKFAVERNIKSPLETEEMNAFIISLSSTLFNKKAYIVPTRDDKFIALSEFKEVSLVGVEEFKVTFNDVLKMHQENMRMDDKVKLSSLKNRWVDKVNFIEEKVIPSIKVEDYYYQMVIICVIHSIGMANNAISYLQDTIIDFGDNVKITTLAHKRLSLNSYDLLNPFNLIVDSPLRDIAELYKNEEIDEQEVISYFINNNVSPKEVSIFFARLLYPTKIFDLLERNYQKRGDIIEGISTYFNNVDIMMDRIKKIHNYLVENYGIRKITWL